MKKSSTDTLSPPRVLRISKWPHEFYDKNVLPDQRPSSCRLCHHKRKSPCRRYRRVLFDRYLLLEQCYEIYCNCIISSIQFSSIRLRVPIFFSIGGVDNTFSQIRFVPIHVHNRPVQPSILCAWIVWNILFPPLIVFFLQM